MFYFISISPPSNQCKSFCLFTNIAIIPILHFCCFSNTFFCFDCLEIIVRYAALFFGAFFPVLFLTQQLLFALLLFLSFHAHFFGEITTHTEQ